MENYTIREMHIGQGAEFTKTISESDVYLFAGLTGDLNPAHINDGYAQNTKFGRRIAHGMLSAGLISAVIGTKFPGPGSIYVGQTLQFVAPVFIGDTITASVQVKELNIEKNRVQLKTVCTNQNGQTVVTGEATIMPPRYSDMRREEET